MKKSIRFTLIVLLSGLSTAGYGNSGDDSRAAFLSLDQDKLYYKVSGQGFPLVLVSGGSGMDMRQWDLITPTLAESYQVIRYDPRGIGKSDNPTKAYSDTADLESLLDHLKLDRVGLIGLSSAGGLVLEFAVRHPDRISGLVVAAPFLPEFEFSDAMMVRLMQFNQGAEKGREPFLDQIFGDAHFIPAPLHRSVRTYARKVMAFNFDKSSEHSVLPTPMEPPLIEQLSTITSPALLLAGELDHPEVLRRNKFILTQLQSAHEIIIRQAGHNGPLENPKAFLNAMSSFLQGISQQ